MQVTVSSFVLWRLPDTYISPAETGLYYLQSRYYNPERGRFINVDAYIATGQGVLGYNIFAYCMLQIMRYTMKQLMFFIPKRNPI